LVIAEDTFEDRERAVDSNEKREREEKNIPNNEKKRKIQMVRVEIVISET